MSGTFTKIYIQIVFAVEHRNALIYSEWEEELFKYTTGIINRKQQKMIAINGMPDHIHFLVGIKSTCCLSDFVREIKKSTNEFIREKKFTPYQFNWQEGYGAFSYSHWDLDSIIKYIHDQKEHHKKINFRQEYTELLRNNHIELQNEYLFQFFH